MRPKIIALVALLSLTALVRAQEGPNRPEAKPVTLDAKTTAVLVLDLNARCHDAKQICNKLTPGGGDFVGKARGAGVLTVFPGWARAKGPPPGGVPSPPKPRENEPVIYPDAF